MVHRDPETGQFVGDDDQMIDDIEVATFGASVGVEASNLGGGTGFGGGDNVGFDGVELIDYDEIVDRNEELVLLSGHHSISVYSNATSTEDGTISCSVEVSADPAISSATRRVSNPVANAIDGTTAVGESELDDSIDLIGRPLSAVGTSAFSDTSTGVGGAGSAGEDRVEITMAPAEFGRFHPRDELFANGVFTATNIDDTGIHVNLSGQHIYGVMES